MNLLNDANVAPMHAKNCEKSEFTSVCREKVKAESESCAQFKFAIKLPNLAACKQKDEEIKRAHGKHSEKI